MDRTHRESRAPNPPDGRVIIIRQASVRQAKSLSALAVSHHFLQTLRICAAVCAGSLACRVARGCGARTGDESVRGGAQTAGQSCLDGVSAVKCLPFRFPPEGISRSDFRLRDGCGGGLGRSRPFGHDTVHAFQSSVDRQFHCDCRRRADFCGRSSARFVVCCQGNISGATASSGAFVAAGKAAPERRCLARRSD